MDFITAVERFARASGKTLAPEWALDLQGHPVLDGVDAPYALESELEWTEPECLVGRPRPDQFPVLVHDPEHGWLVAIQWDDDSVKKPREEQEVIAKAHLADLRKMLD